VLFRDAITRHRDLYMVPFFADHEPGCGWISIITYVPLESDFECDSSCRRIEGSLRAELIGAFDHFAARWTSDAQACSGMEWPDVRQCPWAPLPPL
jgi:hypothetical protein